NRAHSLGAWLADMRTEQGEILSFSKIAELMREVGGYGEIDPDLFENRQNPRGCTLISGANTTCFQTGGATDPAETMHKLSVARWLVRDIPPTDWLLGGVLSATSKTLGYSPTGLGKTNLYMAAAIHMAAGKDFLHWRTPRPSRWLYVDGEMPADL